MVASNATRPDVYGETAADAQQRLAAVGLSSAVTASIAVASWGTVVGMEPQPRLRVPRGSTVTIEVVSLSAEQLRGRTLVDARAILSRRGLRVSAYYASFGGRIVDEEAGTCKRFAVAAVSQCIVAAFGTPVGGEARLGVVGS